MIRWMLGIFGYRIVYVSEFGTHDTRYDSLDAMMGRPVHENMSVAPPWAGMRIVRSGSTAEPIRIHPLISNGERRQLCGKGCCVECAECSAKPGSPALCPACLELRRLCAATGEGKAMRRFRKGDRVVVRGCDLAFVFEAYMGGVVKLFIEGESRHTLHHIVHAKEEAILPNNHETLIAEGWLRPA